MKILKFEWDNAKGEEHNGKSLIIGQHLPKAQNIDATHLEIYGISLDIADTTKDYQLKRQSCYGENICGEVKEISKEDARKLLMAEIDKALDIMYNNGEQQAVNENLNVLETADELEED